MKQILAILLLLDTSFFTPVLADDTHDDEKGTFDIKSICRKLTLNN